MGAFAAAIADAGVGVPRFQSVLCVVEFDRLDKASLSEASRSALRHGSALARRDGGRVTVLHVLPVMPRTLVFSGGRLRDLAADKQRHVEEAASRLSRAIASEILASDVDVRVTRGVPIDEITSAAVALDADVIVAGYQDRPGGYSEGFSFRSLLHRAPCPVFVTRPGGAAATGPEP